MGTRQDRAEPRAAATAGRRLLTGVAVALVWFAATAFFFTIIGVFGVPAALAGLALFVALAGLGAGRPQRTEGQP